MGTLSQLAFYRLIADANRNGDRVVTATVVHTRGSTPQRRGAKMLFLKNGEVAGTVGGGCIEAEVWAEAREAFRTAAPSLNHYSLTADEASEEGMVCGGTMDIFIDVWDPAERSPNVDANTLYNRQPAIKGDNLWPPL
jgi:xanthine/CO dehydrogenase XdhC/CoxF family maturation factor